MRANRTPAFRRAMTSYVVYDGPSRIDGERILVLLSSVDLPSKNTKTGPMYQCSILVADMPPWDALRSGRDYSICGTCPHRPQAPGGRERTCYVDLRFISPIWHARRAPFEDAIAWGAEIRLGQYGDPWAAPIDVWRRLTRHARLWTGYTEFWREAQADSPWWRHIFMASVSSAEEAREAHVLGWRTYRTLAPDERLELGEIMCPHYADESLQCIKCQLCDGVAPTATLHGPDRRRSIAAPVHGSGRAQLYAARKRSQAAERRLALV